MPWHLPPDVLYGPVGCRPRSTAWPSSCSGSSAQGLGAGNLQPRADQGEPGPQAGTELGIHAALSKQNRIAKNSYRGSDQTDRQTDSSADEREDMPATENLADLVNQGYLPVDINAAERVISFAKLAHASFHEVWYDDTVAAAKANGTIPVPLRAFVDEFADRSDGEYLNLIAHTSRCGSTLLANLLGLRPTTMVLKEPDFVTIPARGRVLAADSKEACESGLLLKALLNFSRHTAAAAERELVVKLTSWSAPVVMDSLRDSRNTRWLFSWREPEEVVASNRATHPSWGQDTENGRAARILSGASDTTTGSVRFYANSWRRTVDSFLSAGCDVHWRALGYRELASEKATSLLAAQRWFALSAASELPPNFNHETKRYSKGSRVEAFEPNQSHLRKPLGPQEAREVTAITERALKVLLQKEHRLF